MFTVSIGRLIDALDAYQKAQEEDYTVKKSSLKFKKVRSINSKLNDQPGLTVSNFEEDKYENFRNKQTLTGSARPYLITDQVGSLMIFRTRSI